MSTTVMSAVLLAALLHAGWNYLVKRGDDRYLSMTAVVLGHAPFGALALLWAPLPKLQAWPYLLGGALLHVGYQLFLLASYRIGDLSHVYPLARGVAPLLVAGISVGLLGASLSSPELLAVGVVATGVISLTLVRGQTGLRNPRAATLALITGGFIASYSLVDGMGARAAQTALGFYGWLTVIDSIIFAAVIRIVRPGTLTRLRRRGVRLALVGGGASFLAYAIVVWAFTQAPIALVTALRETSIILAMILGVVFLKERLDLNKVFATTVTIIGVVLLRFAR